MTNFYVGSSFVSTTTTNYRILASGDTITVGKNGEIVYPIPLGFNGNNRAAISGSVVALEGTALGSIGVNGYIDISITPGALVTAASGAGIFFEHASSFTLLRNGGSITALTGVNVTGALASSVDNSGTILAATLGVKLHGTLTNTGTIESSSAGIQLTGAGNKVVNDGRISANGLAVDFLAAESGSSSLINTGWIGGGQAVRGSAFQDFVTQSGTIVGDVNLGAGSDSFDGRLGSTSGSVDGGLDGDTLMGSAAWGDALFGSDGIDTLYGYGGDDRLDGGNDVDFLYGGDGHDLIFGGLGADTLEGGDGDDVLDGSLDEDLIRGGAGNDLIRGGFGADRIDGGEGIDTLEAESQLPVQGLPPSTVVIDLEDTSANTGFEAGDIYISIENVNGAFFAFNTLSGNSGTNVLRGNIFADVLDGRGGADVMIGDAGDDTYFVDDTGDNVIEAQVERVVPPFGPLPSGNDTIFSSANYSLTGRYVETLNLIGAGNISASGNSLANTLNGNAGDNILTGFSGDDTLNGFAGADRLDGGGGNDSLNGGAGIDTMLGGAGNDVYFVDDAGDVVIENDASSIDLVSSSISYSLAGLAIENLTLTGAGSIDGTGNALANILIGNVGNNGLVGDAGNDTLDGGEGADTMGGGAGNDIYFVDNVADIVNETDATSIDTIFASASYNLSGRLIETLTLTGTANIAATGNSLANILNGNSGNNGMNGNGGDDVLNGFGGADTLIGGDGNDILDGGAGADSMTGGTGNDVYFVADAGDNVIETDGTGTDTIFSAVTYNLTGRLIETLTLSGAANIAATGNSLANVLNGNTGNNGLSGNGGDDQLHGFLGIDTLSGGGGADRFYFETALSAGNIDTIADFTSGSDSMGLAASIFTEARALGTLNSNAFFTGAAAADASDRIIYNSATGALLYDSDGVGAAAAVQFASLQANLSLSASDFFLL